MDLSKFKNSSRLSNQNDEKQNIIVQNYKRAKNWFLPSNTAQRS